MKRRRPNYVDPLLFTELLSCRVVKSEDQVAVVPVVSTRVFHAEYEQTGSSKVEARDTTGGQQTASESTKGQRTCQFVDS